jgi:hypothetical protein
MSDVSTSPGMRDLVLRLARHRRGLAFLHLVDLEPAAVTLGVDARVVAQAREALATPQGRAELIAAVGRARQEAPLSGAAAATPPSAPRPPRSGRELIRAAAEHAYGLEFLRDGYLESVAVVFQVHPKLVLRARALLERWEARQGRLPGG